MSKGEKIKLSPQQELFCQLYIKDYFGNGVKSYIIAYKKEFPIDVEYRYLNPDEKKRYDSYAVRAAQLLRNLKMVKRIGELLDEHIEDAVVDREMIAVILQKEDLTAKMRAISEYNKVKQRIISKSEIEKKVIKVDKTSKEFKEYKQWRLEKRKLKEESQERLARKKKKK